MSNALVINPTTGFLESISAGPSVAVHRTHFTSDLKLEFLRLIDESIRLQAYPSIHNICETVGISIKTFEYHVQNDKVFGEAWKERTARLKSVFTVELAHKAMSKMGTLANLAMLRYLESGTWLPETRVNHISDSSASKSVVNSLIEVRDAEIVVDSPQIGQASPGQGSALQ